MKRKNKRKEITTIIVIVGLIILACFVQKVEERNKKELNLAPMGEGMQIFQDGKYVYTNPGKSGIEIVIVSKGNMEVEKDEDVTMDSYKVYGEEKAVEMKVHCRYCGWYRKATVKKGETWGRSCLCPNMPTYVLVEY